MKVQRTTLVPIELEFRSEVLCKILKYMLPIIPNVSQTLPLRSKLAIKAKVLWDMVARMGDSDVIFISRVHN